MHVLHRPDHLHRAALAAVAAALMVIVLALAIADGLHAFTSASTAAGAPTSPAAVHRSSAGSQTSNPFAHRPFTSPFTTPAPLTWAPSGD